MFSHIWQTDEHEIQLHKLFEMYLNIYKWNIYFNINYIFTVRIIAQENLCTLRHGFWRFYLFKFFSYLYVNSGCLAFGFRVALLSGLLTVIRNGMCCANILRAPANGQPTQPDGLDLDVQHAEKPSNSISFKNNNILGVLQIDAHIRYSGFIMWKEHIFQDKFWHILAYVQMCIQLERFMNNRIILFRNIIFDVYG